MVTTSITCPACGAHDLDVGHYESMMVLKTDVALFTLRCPHCSTVVSSVSTIPPHLREEVWFAAIELGAGMGREN